MSNTLVKEKRYDLKLPTIIQGHLSDYLKRSGDTLQEYLDAPKPMYVYAPTHVDGWVEYDIHNDIMWVRTAFSGDPKQTKKAWTEIKQLAKNYGCKKIQFQTKHNPKVMKRLFGANPVLTKMEVKL